MKTFITALFFSILLSVSAQENETLVLRHPSVNNAGTEIAFSYQGDIWISSTDGSDPRRITIHEAYESAPIWSPDDSQLAFNSTRFGNNDIYVSEKTGGLPKRITYHSSSDDLTDWADDGSLLFTTTRAYVQIERDDEIFMVDSQGGTPFRLMNGLGLMAVKSPNGKMVAFVRGSCRVSREDYEGPANKDLWLWNKSNDTYTQLTTNDKNDYMPRWGDDNTLYFISARSGRYNIHKMEIDKSGKSTNKQQITNYSNFGVRHFDVSTNGNLLVMERKAGIFTSKLDGSDEKEVNLQILTDYRFDPIEHKKYSSNVSSYQVSPNSKKIALEIHGEIFITENDKEKDRTVNISNHGYRDQSPQWLNDSTVLFTSDREGQFDIYMAKSADENKTDIFRTLKLEVVKLTDTEEDESGIQISPDGKKIAYLQGRGKMIIADIDEAGSLSNSRTLQDGWATPSGVAWSPDSRWVAYSMPDLNFNSEIYIHSAINNSAPVNVSMHPRGDSSPIWSKDGSKLVFISNRENNDYDVWFVWLKEEDWEKTQEDRDEGYYFEEEEKEDKKDDKDEDKKIDPIQIDFNEIHDRLVKVTSLPGNETNVQIDKEGETIFFTSSTPTSSGSDLFSIKWDGKDIKQLTSGGSRIYRLSLDSKGDLYGLKSGKVYSIDQDKGKLTLAKHSASLTINNLEERKQVFNEAWRELYKGFYDPDFHGYDFEELKNTYADWCFAASTKQDFRYMFNVMLGQLNASHMGLYGSNPEKTQREATGRLGIEIEPVRKGVRVTRVVKDTPATKEKSTLSLGDIIVKVNGVEIEDNINFYSMFTNEVSEQVLLELEDGEEIVIRPSSSIRTALYEEWIDEKKALVEKYSNGRLGYIHIRGMNMTSFERFERELMASGYGKEGIVIDVRYNGGGWTTDYMMAVLNVRQHAYTVPRGATQNLEANHTKFANFYPFSERLPLSWLTKPSVAMCNTTSYSNAEIFSHAYKNLGIGKLVGEPTFGAVISTGGAGLMDGSYVRMPFRGWYVKSTMENMEHGPAVPDYILSNDPDGRAKGEDKQLKKAVEVLLDDLK